MAGKGLNCMRGDTPDFSELDASDVVDGEGELPSLDDLMGVASSVVVGGGSSFRATSLGVFSLEDFVLLVSDKEWLPLVDLLTVFFGEGEVIS